MQTSSPATAIIVADPATLTRLTLDGMVAHPADSARISKAYDLVAAGAVERTATPHRFLVLSQSQANAAYTVDERTGCQCADAARRDARNCKHVWAMRLAVQAERAEADALAPIAGGALALPVITVDPEDSILDLWPADLPGEPCALPRQCARCGQEAAVLAHPDRLGAACIADELYPSA